jgi:hypothetical protein
VGFGGGPVESDGGSVGSGGDPLESGGGSLESGYGPVGPGGDGASIKLQQDVTPTVRRAARA